MKIQIRAKRAFDALKKLGAPVNHFGEGWGGSAQFSISAEENYDGVVWADYYNEFNLSSLDDFGINEKIAKILTKYKLYTEWSNAGVADVYDAEF
jgi:hypothetical protein